MAAAARKARRLHLSQSNIRALALARRRKIPLPHSIYGLPECAIKQAFCFHQHRRLNFIKKT